MLISLLGASPQMVTLQLTSQSSPDIRLISNAELQGFCTNGPLKRYLQQPSPTKANENVAGVDLVLIPNIIATGNRFLLFSRQFSVDGSDLLRVTLAVTGTIGTLMNLKILYPHTTIR